MAQDTATSVVKAASSWSQQSLDVSYLWSHVLPALVVLLLFYGLGLLIRTAIRWQMQQAGREQLGQVLGGVGKWFMLLLGGVLAISLLIPSLTAGDLLLGLGLGAVAIGFAFRDMLQNGLCGLLLLLRPPFAVHDQIAVNEHEGRVVRVAASATVLNTADGQHIRIPNRDLYTQAVRVSKAHQVRRCHYDVGIGHDEDMNKTCQLLSAALAKLEEVARVPAPQALAWSLAPSRITVRLLWWTQSHNVDLVHAKVIGTIKQTLDEAGISLPADSLVCLLQDMTDDGEFDEEAPLARH